MTKITGLLPDHEIRRSVKIDPFAEGTRGGGVLSYGLGSYGYDARLGRDFRVFSPVYGDLVLDPKKIDERLFHRVTGDHCVIPPNSYILGESLEYFEIPRDVLCICLGKSTLARVGLIVNVTPLEPGWRGHITIEVSNSAPVPAKVYAGEGIMQILFFRAQQECGVSYADKSGVYMDQGGLTLARVKE